MIIRIGVLFTSGTPAGDDDGKGETHLRLDCGANTEQGATHLRLSNQGVTQAECAVA